MPVNETTPRGPKGKDLEKRAAEIYQAIPRAERMFEAYADLPEEAKELWRENAYRRWKNNG